MKEILEKNVGFSGINNVLQRIESRQLQIKEFPDLWYFIGLIELIGEKEKSKEWSIDKCQHERKKLIKEYFTETNY